MADQDTLRRIIQQEIPTMGSAYRPGEVGANAARRLGISAPNPGVAPPVRTTGGAMPPAGFATDMDTPDEADTRERGRADAEAERAFRQAQRIFDMETANRASATAAGIDLGDTPPLVAPIRPGSAFADEAPGAGLAPSDAPATPQQGLGPAPQGILAQNPDIMFARPDAGATETPAPPLPETPAKIVAQAGLGMVAQGERPPISAHAPELYDPETGTRPEEARKLGLLDRMFGEEGSDKRGSMGKALMMAGAAIMSTSGSVGEAIGAGIQAGVMTYDQAQQALRDEEREARKLGMTEEAHALNMELKRLQLDRARMGGGSGPVKPEGPTLQEKVAEGLVLADILHSQFKQPMERALSIGAQQGLGLPAGTANPWLPRQDDWMTGVMAGQ